MLQCVMKSMLKSFLVGLFVCFAFVSTNTEALELRGQNVGSKFPRVMFDVLSVLPSRVKSTINSKIYINFAPQEGDAFGRTVRKNRFQSLSKINTIELSSNFIPALKGKRIKSGSPWSLKNARETLIHELGHIYDYRFNPTAKRKAEIAQCNKSQLSRLRRTRQSHRNRMTTTKEKGTRLSSRCSLLQKQSTNISEDPRFLYLTGWHENGKIKNTRSTRIAKHALKNPREFYAVHFSWFLTDPNFQCRMPALNEYFKGHFGYQPHAKSDCYLDTEVSIKNSASFLDIDPERLYEVHFLHASKGTNIESKFGHSLIRLVMCSPKREKVGPECLKDVRYHVVMAFNGNVMELTQSVVKGITGAYESQLLFFRWSTVEKDYTKDQLRNLDSIPLKISRVEMTQLVYRALELHWTYGGDYKFFSNNCATEIYDMLRATVNNEYLWEEHILTPNGAYKVLEKSGLLDVSKKKVYETYLPKLQKAYEQLIKSQNDTGVKSVLGELEKVEDYLEETYSDERGELYKNTIEQSSLKDPRLFLGSMYLLENYILGNLKLKMGMLASNALIAGQSGKLKPRIGKNIDPVEERKMQEELMVFVAEVDRLLELKKSLIPSKRIEKGYGIPLDEDYPEEDLEADEEKISAISKEIKEIYKARNEFFNKYFKFTADELKGSKANMLLHVKKIREIGI